MIAMVANVRIVMSVMVVAASCAVAPSSAWACSCNFGDNVSFEAAVVQEFGWAERVFAGRVRERDEAAATFEVDTIWKGDTAAAVSVKHGDVLNNGVVRISTCDYRFRESVRYVVFAYREGSALKASICGHTSPFEEAQRAVAVLDGLAERINRVDTATEVRETEEQR